MTIPTTANAFIIDPKPRLNFLSPLPNPCISEARPVITVITAEKPRTVSAIPESILSAASGLELILSNIRTAATISASTIAIMIIPAYAFLPYFFTVYDNKYIIAAIIATNANIPSNSSTLIS